MPQNSFLRKFLAATKKVTLTSLAQVADGLWVAQDSDGEWVVYINLKLYHQTEESKKAISLKSASSVRDFGIFFDVTAQSPAEILMRLLGIIRTESGDGPAIWLDWKPLNIS